MTRDSRATAALADDDRASGPGGRRTTANTPPAHVRWRWHGLAAICLSVLVVGLDSMVLMVALPTLAAQLHASAGDLEWTQDSYLLTLAGLMLPIGLLGDRLGRKRVLIVGLLFFGAASALSAQAGSPSVLIGARALMGVGAAVIVPLSMSVLPAMFPPAERPKAVGVLAAGTAVGLPLGPIVGGLLLEHFWWGSVFLINVPVVLLAVTGVAVLTPESRDRRAPRLDLPGVLLSAGGLTGLVFAIIEVPTRGWADGAVAGLGLGGLLALLAFLWWQRRVSEPIAPVRLLTDRGFGVGTLVVSLVSFALFGVLFAVPQYLQQVQGRAVLGVGLRLLPLMVALLVGSLASERLVRRWSRRGTVGAGMAVVAGALALLSTLRPESGYTVLATGLALAGVGLGCAVAPSMDAVLGSLSPAKTGVGSALSNALKQVAGALGVAVLGSVLAAGYRSGLAGPLAALPAPTAQAARAQLAGALAVADRLGPTERQRLGVAARTAFVHGMSLVMLVAAAVVLVGAVVVVWRLPNADSTSVPSTPAGDQPQ